jgi:hypothetical protein
MSGKWLNVKPLYIHFNGMLTLGDRVVAGVSSITSEAVPEV